MNSRLPERHDKVHRMHLTISHPINIASTPELRSLSTAHPNLLLEGTETSIDDVLVQLKDHLGGRVIWRRHGAQLELPPDAVGTLILQDVPSLAADQQLQLLEWLNGAGQRTQVVSTSSQPLFELVERGLFDETLYYRLNVILLRVDADLSI